MLDETNNYWGDKLWVSIMIMILKIYY
jgi:hypothetical protein